MADEQPSHEERLAEAEQALRDERVERDAAQRRAVELSSRADLWRSRSEERGDRIRRLEAERDALRTPQGWVRARLGRLRGGEGATVSWVDPGLTAPMRAPRPALPGVRVGALVDGGPVRLLLREANTRDLAEEASMLSDSDVVVVDTVSAGRRGEELAPLLAWLELPARQPLILVWSEDEPLVDERLQVLADAADLVLSDSRAARDRCGDRVRPLPATFDPSVENPVGRVLASVAKVTRDADGDYTRLHDESGAIVAVQGPASWRDDPPDWLVSLAARGLPILGRESGDVGNAETGRAATAARRWAYREHDPAIVWERILAAVRLSVPPVRPMVAGLLVSKRPEDLPAAIGGFAAQRHPRKELVVGCHGFPAAMIGDALEAVGDVPVRVIEFDSSVPLGRCLNESAAATGAGVLAKIDDDDYYGPGYLEDAVQALRYSGSRIIGKATQFTYLEDDDVTVLRRPGTEESPIEGAVTGASLVFDRSVWEAVRFPHRPRRVDALFLRGSRCLGETVYANTRWDFVYRRRRSGHTWEIAPDALANDAVPVWDGWHPERSHADD